MVMTNHNDNNTQRNIGFLQLCASPAQENFPSFASQSAGGDNFRTADKYPKNPRKKKRTKLIRIDNPLAVSSSGSGGVAKPKYGKKPDPSAPKITRPCTECGRKFWSWKALFGHMRCHPERQWRGINPPPNFRRPVSPESDVQAGMTQEDHEVAACLLMLANAPRAFHETQTQPANNTTIANRSLLPLESDAVVRDGDDVDGAGPSGVSYGFECSSCKKVFGSHQALGGHRASHKNVKGCFAITRSDAEEVVSVLDHNGRRVDDRCCQGEFIRDYGDERMAAMVSGHTCSICLKVFSSGQALGGHKRCHWERGDEPSSLSQGLNLSPFGGTSPRFFGLDLNLPAPVEDDLSSSYSSGLVLDLRLGI